MDKNHLIKQTIADCMSNFLCYDRKEDDDLPTGEIEKCIYCGVISIPEILDIVKKILEDDYNDYLKDNNL